MLLLQLSFLLGEGRCSSADSVAVADVNGDGKPDVLVASEFVINDYNNGTVGVLLGNGDGTFQTAVTYGSGGDAARSVALGDVNGDGKPDVLVGNGSSPGTVGVLLGNGDGTFQTAVSYNSGGNDARSVAVADVNRDGKPDVLVANNGGGDFSKKTTTCGTSLPAAANCTISVTLKPTAIGTRTGVLTIQDDTPVDTSDTQVATQETPAAAVIATFHW